MRGFDVVVDDRQAAALVLEGIGDRVELALNDRDLGVDIFRFAFDCFASGFGVLVELGWCMQVKRSLVFA